MSQGLPGFAAPGVGFEVPLEMLSACHHRIEQQCATLRRLVAHLHARGADAEARAAAAGVIRYFDTAAKDHHADEEEDLFPALLESMAGSDAVCLRALTARLGAEHRQLEAGWKRLRPELERTVAGHPSSLDAADVEDFVGRYERHIQCEELELLPMAARLLTDEDLDRVGKAMRERRGIASGDGTDL